MYLFDYLWEGGQEFLTVAWRWEEELGNSLAHKQPFSEPDVH
jgi:hypothetical protein